MRKGGERGGRMKEEGVEKKQRNRDKSNREIPLTSKRVIGFFVLSLSIYLTLSHIITFTVGKLYFLSLSLSPKIITFTIGKLYLFLSLCFFLNSLSLRVFSISSSFIFRLRFFFLLHSKFNSKEKR